MFTHLAGFFLVGPPLPKYKIRVTLTGHCKGCGSRVVVSIDMSVAPTLLVAPTVKHLEARLRSLDAEVEELRCRLEEQNLRMAQMALENDNLRTRLLNTQLAELNPQKGARRGSGVLSNEEMDFALSMARNTVSPAAR